MPTNQTGVPSKLVAELVRKRAEHVLPLHLRSTARDLTDGILGLLFPHFAETKLCDDSEVECELHHIELILTELSQSLGTNNESTNLPSPSAFFERLPRVYESLSQDAVAIHHGDPASTSVDEVILCYPGFYAIAVHRVAHLLNELGFALIPRLMSEYAHHRTGIDIHPAATIGRSFFIDHGTGVVIGETAVIGNGVKIYQGVTLGATSVQRTLKGRKRHPTIGNHVVIYANATILGGETEIGHDSVIGGNAWITESVPPFSIVGRNSEVRTRRSDSDDFIEFNI